MSKATEQIKANLDRYIQRMKDLGKEPSALYVTRQQWEVLRAAARADKDSFRPRYRGFEVKIAK